MDTRTESKSLEKNCMYDYNDFDTVKFQFDFTGTGGR